MILRNTQPKSETEATISMSNGCNIVGNPIFAEHDRLTFEELQSVYSFGKTSDRRELFSKLVLDELAKKISPTVLEIGCGSGMGVGKYAVDYQNRIANKANQFWGIEPSDSPVQEWFDRVERCLFEDCTLPDNSVDVAYSHMVMEHVINPDKFFQRLERVLRPGGCYLFLTPNGASYFGLAGLVLHRLGIDENLLRVIKDKKSIDEYHFPVAYQCNRPSQIASWTSPLGLSMEVGYYERNGAPGYFPKWSRPLLSFLCWKRRLIRRKHLLINLVCRIYKPTS